jgi:type VI secretion system protein ImpA
VKDLDDLLQAISPENPCGLDIEESLPHSTEFQTLEALASAESSQDFSGSNADHTEIDWREVERLSLSLFESGKHLRLAVYLCSAWLHTKKLQGFAHGIKLVRQLNEQYWEDAYPKLTFDGDFDADFRINALNNLCDYDAILKPLTQTSLVSAPGLGSFSLRDYKLALGEIPHQATDNTITVQQIEAAFSQQAPDDARQIKQAVDSILEDLDALESWIDEKLKGQHYQPLALTPLRKELDRIAKLIRSYSSAQDEQPLTQSENQASSEQPNDKQGAAMPNNSAAVPSGTINSREDVIRSLDKICNYYQANEPSSPVPLLINRAKALVTADFLEIIENLNPDSLQKIKDLGGIKTEQASTSKSSSSW